MLASRALLFSLGLIALGANGKATSSMWHSFPLVYPIEVTPDDAIGKIRLLKILWHNRRFMFLFIDGDGVFL